MVLDVPCGNYRIQPRVMANLRLATQAVLPKTTGEGEYQGFPSDDHDRNDRIKRYRSRNKRNYDGLPPARSFLDPLGLQRTLQSFTPYQTQPFTEPRPSFRPRTCRWNFNVSQAKSLN